MVRNPQRAAAQVVSVTLNGAPLEVTAGVARIPLSRDGGSHRIDVLLG
jgi:hypothetical protein